MGADGAPRTKADRLLEKTAEPARLQGRRGGGHPRAATLPPAPRLVGLPTANSRGRPPYSFATYLFFTLGLR